MLLFNVGTKATCDAGVSEGTSRAFAVVVVAVAVVADVIAVETVVVLAVVVDGESGVELNATGVVISSLGGDFD